MIIANAIFLVVTMFFGYYMLHLFSNIKINLIRIESRLDSMLKERLDGSKKAE